MEWHHPQGRARGSLGGPEGQWRDGGPSLLLIVRYFLLTCSSSPLFLSVADDEARHLGWCLQRMAELGCAYGDMDAHDLLWQGCSLSSGDVAARWVSTYGS